MKSKNIFLATGLLALVLVLYLFLSIPKTQTEPSISREEFFTIQNIQSVLPDNLPKGWNFNGIEEKGTVIWGDAISKQNKTIEVRYFNSEANTTQISRENGERIDVPKETVLYFFPDLWSQTDKENYVRLISSPELMIRAVSYPTYLKQTSSFRIMYLSDDEGFIQYLNSSIKDLY